MRRDKAHREPDPSGIRIGMEMRGEIEETPILLGISSDLAGGGVHFSLSVISQPLDPIKLVNHRIYSDKSQIVVLV
jgi:hypothetical protein